MPPPQKSQRKRQGLKFALNKQKMLKNEPILQAASEMQAEEENKILKERMENQASDVNVEK